MKWVRMFSVLGPEGSDAHNSGTFYKLVVQAILLFGSETWVTTPCIGLTLGGYHHRVDSKLKGIQPQREA